MITDDESNELVRSIIKIIKPNVKGQESLTMSNGVQWFEHTSLKFPAVRFGVFCDSYVHIKEVASMFV